MWLHLCGRDNTQKLKNQALGTINTTLNKNSLETKYLKMYLLMAFCNPDYQHAF